MATRRSGRATKEVKYTSASEGSDFEDKKKRAKRQTKTVRSKEGATTTTTKKTSKAAETTKKATSKQVTKKRAAQSDDDDNDDVSTNDNDATTTSTAPKPKRQKKDPATLAAEAQEKQAKADKAAHKQAWQDWLSSHNVVGELLAEEPGKDESMTQTDALKKYGVKKEELNSLMRFEKKNPLYPGMMKLFLEDDVRELAFRKMGVLEGVQGDDEDIIKRGEELWNEEHKDDVDVDVDEKKPVRTETKEKDAATDEKADQPAKTKKPNKDNKPARTEKPKNEKTPKQKWAAYLSANAIDEDGNLAEEPSDAINQTECKNKYTLTPKDLACLPYLPKKNPAYGNTTKLFKESVVKSLAYRKTAVLAGLEDDEKDDEALLEKGQKLFDEQHGSDEDE